MTGPTHVIVAVTATLILGPETGIPGPTGWGWVAVIGGSLLPDIDEPRSTVSNPAGVFGKLVPRWVQKFFNAPFQALSEGIRSVFGHRGATHYLIWPLIMGWLAWQNQLPVLFWLGWGYLWHEIADSVTIAGIPALGPIYRKSVSFLPKSMRMRTGGAGEDLVNTVCWIYLIYFAYFYF